MEALRAIRLKTEPPYAERHVRWCERAEKIRPTRLNAPYRTVQEWNAGRRTPPKWIQQLIIRSYVEKNTFEGTLQLQRQLMADYEEDIRKYAEGADQTRILNVFRQIPPQLAKENKKFQIRRWQKGRALKIIGVAWNGCAMPAL